MQFFRRFPSNLNQKLFSTKAIIDPKELALFERLTPDWWDLEGPVKMLHGMNKLRLSLVKDGLINQGVIPRENSDSPTPLKGVSILDVGCGGGILAEALALQGAEVTGVDANNSAIELAKRHAQSNNISVEYQYTSIEEHASENMEKYDAITASEVIEHVTEKEEFLKDSVKCLKPGGSMFLTTMNKTIYTQAVSIYAFENILNLVPKGAHQIEKCISPEELQRILGKFNRQTKEVKGMYYNMFKNDWSFWKRTCFSYSLQSIKNPSNSKEY